MKRDLELARQILKRMEERNYAESGHSIEIEGYRSEEVHYHLMLLDDAGLIVAEDVSSQTALIWLPMHLTWAGHEFLDASRDQDRWEKAERIIESKGGMVTFEIVKELLTQLMRRDVLGDHC